MPKFENRADLEHTILADLVAKHYLSDFTKPTMAKRIQIMKFLEFREFYKSTTWITSVDHQNSPNSEIPPK